jgi:hypothetical protein
MDHVSLFLKDFVSFFNQIFIIVRTNGIYNASICNNANFLLEIFSIESFNIQDEFLLTGVRMNQKKIEHK